jgi:Cu(I)/Ag(I) efflux system membrane fusion protein
MSWPDFRFRPALVAAAALAVIAVLALVAWLALRPRGPEISDSAMRGVGPLSVGLANLPASPQVGANRLRLRVERAGLPARDLDLDAVVFMPAMGAMPYMESRPRFRELRPGLYEGEYALVMGGSWEVDLRLRRRDGETSRVALRLTVGNPGFTWVSAEGGDGESHGGAMRDSAAVPIGESIVLSSQRRQEIGVTTEVVRRRTLEHLRRVPGLVSYDETRLAEVTARTGGYVRELFADFTGDRVRRGGTLLTLYAPETYTAQREFVAALAARDELLPGPSRQRAEDLVSAARQRLLLWDLPPTFVEDVERTRRARETMPVLSPVNGVVVEKSAVQGGAVMAGQMLYRLAPLDPIWVVADVYQYELPLLRVGQPASISLPQGAGRARAARIAYILPSLRSETRTAQVRLDVSNGDLALRPEMFVEVELRIPLGERVAVPASAVLNSGERRVVFVDRGGGRLEPREVRLGPQAGEYFPVESGLAEGEIVVTSGNFLVAAESRLRSATRRF